MMCLLDQVWGGPGTARTGAKIQRDFSVSLAVLTMGADLRLKRRGERKKRTFIVCGNKTKTLER